MEERLSSLLARLRERFSPDSDAGEVEAFLRSEGYDRRQIGEILALLWTERTSTERMAQSGDAQRVVHAPMTFRVLGPHERGRFAPEAWGHLLSLSGAGVLNPAELEHLIEHALVHIDGRIDLDDLRSLMEGTGLDDAGSAADHVTVH